MTETPAPPADEAFATSVLYVDADREASFALGRFLKRASLDVRDARTLEAARTLAGERMPALLVIDPALPDGDGTALIAELRAREPWVQIFVVCGTARADQTSVYIAAGASDVAVKPFDVGALAPRVTRLLRTAEQARREITYRQQLEGRLQHAERIATLGTLCATVAHEIANPLSLILANAGVITRALLESTPPERETLEMLAEASHDIQLAATMIETFIKRVRLFSRRGDERRVEGSLSEVVDTALLLLKPRILARSVTIARPSWAAPRASHYPIRLTQAVLNVLTNAIEATKDKGRVSIEYVERGDAIGIVVDDEGPGLPEEMQATEEQPFFTTKESGTGLGLMVIRSIMTEHGGRFELVPRTEGRPGLRARLLLPKNPEQPLLPS